MKAGERGGMGVEKREREGGGQEALFAAHFFLFYVTFCQAFCFLFVYLMKALKGITGCFAASAGVKWELNGSKVRINRCFGEDSKSLEDEWCFALPRNRGGSSIAGAWREERGEGGVRCHLVLASSPPQSGAEGESR